MYDSNESYINVRLKSYSFLGMHLGTLQQIWSIIEEVYNGESFPIEPSALENDEVSMECLLTE